MAQTLADHASVRPAGDAAANRPGDRPSSSRSGASPPPGGLAARARTLGLAMTPQRQVLVRLLEDIPEPFDFEDVLQRLRQGRPQAARAIVYRTLNLLTRSGLLVAVGVQERRRRYIRAGAGPILQLNDMRSDAPVTLDAPELVEAIARFVESHGYRMGKRIEIQVTADDDVETR